MAPDFFEYFRALYPILRSDPSLWCVSAWNDNGRDALVDPSKAELLYRTDFFPGLGWMLLKEMWDELEVKWPSAFWDDWMRQPEQRKDRSCIRPEISRTITFGRKGVSLGQFFDQYLRYIKLNTEFVPFTKQDLSYLLKEKYDEKFIKDVYSAPLVKIEDLQQGGSLRGPGPYRIQYSSRDSFKVFARNLGVMDDLKSGVPRTGYRGVVSFLHRGRRVFLAPPDGWSRYDTSWSWAADLDYEMWMVLKRGESLMVCSHRKWSKFFCLTFVARVWPQDYCVYTQECLNSQDTSPYIRWTLGSFLEHYVHEVHFPFSSSHSERYSAWITAAVHGRLLSSPPVWCDARCLVLQKVWLCTNSPPPPGDLSCKRYTLLSVRTHHYSKEHPLRPKNISRLSGSWRN